MLTRKINKPIIYKVYTLSDPITKEVRYVGMTKHSLFRRLILHKSPTSINWKRNANKMKWITELASQHLKPVIELLEEHTEYKNGLDAEIYWTNQLRAWGFNLLNQYCGRSMGYKTKEVMRSLKSGIAPSPITLKASAEKRRRSVFQISIQGGIVNCWEYIINASTALGIDRGDIGKCCKNTKKTAGGFMWQYCSYQDYLTYKNKTDGQ